LIKAEESKKRENIRLVKILNISCFCCCNVLYRPLSTQTYGG